MNYIDLLRRIKKSKIKDLEQLALKLSAIEGKRKNRWHEEVMASKEPYLVQYPEMTIEDIENALNHCLWHFTGNFYETDELKECGCRCLCMNCEVIPTHPIAVMMRKMADEVTEDIEIIPWRD